MMQLGVNKWIITRLWMINLPNYGQDPHKDTDDDGGGQDEQEQ